METTPEPVGTLNSSHQLHLLTSCEHADKLLSDIEAILAESTSKSPFPKYQQDLSPAQVKVVQDYIARIRAQILRILHSQGITPASPQAGALHAISVALYFVHIAFEECRPKYMRGYGEVPESAVAELHGLVNEIQSLVARLDAFLGRGLGQQARARLQRLEQTEAVERVQRLERIIHEYGLVEFRPALSMLVERLEEHTFDIAVFGRVSSGKSSLLNHLVQSAVLPVGVTPITSVPTRIIYGPEPQGTAWCLDRSPAQFALERLPAFVTEQENPANIKHVVRLVVELPSPRLRPGIVFVDTPGLGSLAAAGTAETMAYLPHCDLGVVLIDAGSTLTPEDLATMQSLVDAGIPAMVLLSKADLLGPEGRERTLQYIADHIAAELGLEPHVRPVSVEPGHVHLLEQWFTQELLPLYGRCLEASQASLRRKIGTLTEAVAAALQTRLTHASGCGQQAAVQCQELEKTLWRLAGRFSETRQKGREVVDKLRSCGDVAITEVASELMDRWQRWPLSGRMPGATVHDILSRVAAERAVAIASACTALARDAAQVLQGTARALGLREAPSEREMLAEVQEMPWLDVGHLDVTLPLSSFFMRFGTDRARRRLARKLRAQAGAHVVQAFAEYGRLLEDWLSKTLSALQARFDAYAEAYRAHLGRLTNDKDASLPEPETIRQELEALLGAQPDESPHLGPCKV
jgi:GTP-binding protein EngB required for normal cell division